MASSNFNPCLLFVIVFVLAFATGAASLRPLDLGQIGKGLKGLATDVKQGLKHGVTDFKQGFKHGVKDGVKDVAKDELQRRMDCNSDFCTKQYHPAPEVPNYLRWCKGCGANTSRVYNYGQP